MTQTSKNSFGFGNSNIGFVPDFDIRISDLIHTMQSEIQDSKGMVWER
jgi:hypothetical protein